jgi:hypothetical protein
VFLWSSDVTTSQPAPPQPACQPTCQPACLLHFDDEAAPAQRLADASGLPAQAIERHRFPDGELKLRLPVDAAGRLPPNAVLLRSLHQPNEKLVELLLAARTARTLGVQHLTLVAPYLAYMRQDIAFHHGEAVSQQVVGGFLAGLFDAVITVDPHLHRIERLEQAIAVPQAIALSGAPARCWWGPMANPPSGSPRPAHATVLTMPCAPRYAMATATSPSNCRPSTPRAGRWCCWTTWPAPAARWRWPHACCCKPAPQRWTWP